jgi:polyhydroxybutyrate depolymerase
VVKRLWFIALLSMLAPAGAETLEKTIQVGDSEREYLLHVPDNLPRNKPVPLLFVLHGGGQKAEIAQRMGFTEVANREDFIVVYPNAVRKNWNDGRNEPGIWSQRNNVDDVGFVSALIREVGRDHPIDPKRVYATGPSNGGIFSNRLGAEMSEQFAAIAPVIGGLAAPLAEKFNPAQPVSVLMINGTEDPLVPYKGGRVTFMGRGRGSIIPTSETIRKWVARDHCNPVPKSRDLPDKDPKDQTRTKIDVYSGGKNGTEVILYTIEGGGHTWPGGVQYLPEMMIGRVCRDFKATDTIWEFFKSHPKP